jgi:RNA polymerase sigma-70 factor (ECF subfamily)
MSTELKALSQQEVGALHAAHRAELERYLLGLVRDAALADDCLQATFAKLLERGHETQPATRRAWLFRVAFQEAMLARRRSATTDRILQKAAWSQCREPAGPDARLLERETVREVAEALECLPPEQRQVVRMRMYEEKTFAVIAQELGIPLGTALGRMRSALVKLREAVDRP